MLGKVPIIFSPNAVCGCLSVYYLGEDWTCSTICFAGVEVPSRPGEHTAGESSPCRLDWHRLKFIMSHFWDMSFNRKHTSADTMASAVHVQESANLYWVGDCYFSWTELEYCCLYPWYFNCFLMLHPLLFCFLLQTVLSVFKHYNYLLFSTNSYAVAAMPFLVLYLCVCFVLCFSHISKVNYENDTFSQKSFQNRLV